MDFEAFFSKAFGQEAIKPLPYQAGLAENPWPELMDVPTGLGKTAAVTLAWLFKRIVKDDADTPRRLIWCLPMRVLVEQTEAQIRTWLRNLGLDQTVALQVLMGGDRGLSARDWLESPERSTILIGTQDMLLSRALMRGYGMSRYQWPVHFAMLHNDALWVYDEVQLMGPALKTASQLEAFRRKMPLARPSLSLWVSATLKPDWLATVDFKNHIQSLKIACLTDADLAHPVAGARVNARKTLQMADCRFDKEGAKQKAKRYLEQLAKEVLSAHRADSQTLVILNRVDRAQGLYTALKAMQKTNPAISLLLLHARFRAAERKRINEALIDESASRNRIVIATQAVEAGVDVSCSTLFTELAPWSSLVQRFGRCNRYGEQQEARIYCVDIDEAVEDAPYTPDSLKSGREKLETLIEQGGDASPGKLPLVDEARERALVLRWRDFRELFNTDPDLSGLDVDISPYIRDTGQPQCQVFWRDFATDPEEPPAESEELCNVGLQQLREHLKKADGWLFNPLEGCWQSVEVGTLRPGMTILLRADQGGYDEELGFVAARKGCVPVIAITAEEQSENYTSDRDTEIGRFVPLVQHLEDVRNSAECLCASLQLSTEDTQAVVTAAYHHDWGKAHEAFQYMVTRHGDTPKDGGPWAKSARSSGRAEYRMKPEVGQELGAARPCFRHELASALAWLETHGEHEQRDLIAYLIAAHHGKVRMGLRALPTENQPKDDRLFARGIWQGDKLPAVGNQFPEGELRLDLRRLGDGPMGPSWATRTQKLLSEIGPFRLAWLEALVRIADWKASKAEAIAGNREDERG